MIIRPLELDDAAAARAFFARIPEGDRRFFKEDVLDPAAVERWNTDPRTRRLVAVTDEGEICGYEALVPGVDWSAHVAELRVVVDPASRHEGVATQLVRRAILMALELGVSKLVVEVVADQDGAVALFRSLGFRPEALLRDHVKDRDGGEHDLMLLVHPIDENVSSMLTLGVDEALG